MCLLQKSLYDLEPRVQDKYKFNTEIETFGQRSAKKQKKNQSL